MDQGGYKLATSGSNAGLRLTLNGQPIDVELRIATNNAIRLSLLTLVCQQLELALNIICHAQVMPTSLFNGYNWRGGLSMSQFDIVLYASENTSDPIGAFPVFDSKNIPSATNPAGQNVDGAGDATLDGMFTQALSELNPTTRKQEYIAIQHYEHDHYYDYPLYVYHDISLISTKLRNYTQGTLKGSNFWDTPDWYLVPNQ
jgi:ABC-type transport system substrate-binding protein